jgi:hypothetical protein
MTLIRSPTGRLLTYEGPADMRTACSQDQQTVTILLTVLNHLIGS